MISDIVQNPFVGRDIVGRALERLKTRGFSVAKIGRAASVIIQELRRGLDAERDRRAEALFREGVKDGRIQFRLRLDGRNWRMPSTVETTQPATAPPLLDDNYKPVERSLFAPAYRADFNGDERNVAVHLDGDKALNWWHRNVARQQYFVQGWKRHRIYPDFIFAVRRGDGSARITVLETKGDQLDNLDTDYKRSLLALMSDSFTWDKSVPAGELALLKDTGETVACELILMSDVPTKLPLHLSLSV